MLRPRWTLPAAGACWALGLALADCSRTDLEATGAAASRHGLAFTTYHFDGARSGWSDAEEVLVPSNVRRGLRRAWVTAPLDPATVTCAGDGAGPTIYPPRLFASPLYLDDVVLSAAPYAGTRASVVLAATTSGWAYAIAGADAPAADGAGVVSAGTVLWRQSLGTPICVPTLDHGTPLGVLGTPVVDAAASPPVEYVAAVNATEGGSDGVWQVFALDVGSGAIVPGWPVVVDPAGVSALDLNSPVPGRPPAMATALVQSQRAALALSPDGSTLFLGFGSYYDGAIGWMVSIDVRARRVAASFSGAPALVAPGADPNDPTNLASGGMWGAGGPAIAGDGRVFMTTGNSPPSSYGSPRVWGNSLLAWTTDLALSATYSPFNYCLLDRGDTDLGGSAPAVFDVDPSRTSTPHLATFGSKQGVVYLVDRDHLGGSLAGRPACDPGTALDDPSTDTSLYGPQGVAAYGGRRGPLPVFGPYSDAPDANALDAAKMRTTPAIFRPASGELYVYVAGNPRPASGSPPQPSVARLRVALIEGQPAYFEPDFARNTSTVLVNAGSPIVTSHDGGQDPVVWVLDQNARRTDPVEPKPGFSPKSAIVHAFDGATMAELWSSDPADLGPGGKYGHVVVAHGTLYVGTDRIAAFVPR